MTETLVEHDSRRDDDSPDSALAAWLGGMGLGVEYVRASGNTLWFHDGDGTEVAVLDHAGGLGTLIFGHHHPELVEHAKAALEAQVPVYAQLSWQTVSDRVAGILDAAIARETGSTERHHAVFANSGAEAVEVCMKHAELERGARLAEQTALIAEHLDEARRAATDGAVVTDPDGLLAGATGSTPDGVEAAVAAIEVENTRRRALPPVWLALEDSFHGKLIGSLQMTQNPLWRTPFAGLAAGACFLSPDDGTAREASLGAVRVGVLDLAVEGAGIRVVEREMPRVAGFLVEPVRGWAGMATVSPDLVAWIRETCTALGCPIIVDEVQSGMGRTGSMLASAQLGLVGDYYAFAKGLGGGIAKNALAFIRAGRFRPEFDIIHSSTFARDGFSARIALKVLEMLETDDGGTYRTIAERGDRLREELSTVCAEFPDVLGGVNGLGLMLAVSVSDQSEAAHEGVRELARGGALCFAAAGFLLREHRIRTAPFGPAMDYLRFSPSLLLTDEEIAATGVALRSLAGALRERPEALMPSPGR